MSWLMLNTIEHGVRTDRPGLLIVHGLYGSARNWGVIAKRLSEDRQVLAVDMRNHGLSPWYEKHSYPDMAGDLAQVLEGLDGPFDVLGHSMGGKAAMVLALSYPELVNRIGQSQNHCGLAPHGMAQHVKGAIQPLQNLRQITCHVRIGMFFIPGA